MPQSQPITDTHLSLRYSRSQRQKQLEDATDRDLLAELRRGEEDALDQLISRKTRPLVQVIYRMVGDLEEARDIVQVTFFRVWERRDRFDDRYSPNTWIYRIATNLAIDHLRSRRSRSQNVEPVRLHMKEIAAVGSRRELSRMHESEVMGIFHELAAELTEKQRLVFLLREVEDLASREVAEIVGCRESTVRNHLFNARKVLRQKLLERYPEYARGRKVNGGAA